jgi:hypothetical protein
MKLWIARDEYNNLKLFEEKPVHITVPGLGGGWEGTCTIGYINRNMFPEVTFENSPQQVEIKLI